MLKENAPREALPFGKPSKPFDVAGFARRYGLIVVVIASFIFTMLVPVVLFISKPNYEVHALMRIDPVIPSLITKSDDPSIINYYGDYANTQARRMMGFEILKKTVEKLTPDEKASILPAALPADKCAGILPFIIKVTPVPGTHLIDVTASSPRKEGLAPLINNFMQVFLDKVRQGNEMQDRERLAYLYHEKQSLDNDIALIEDKLNILTKDISTSDFSETYNLAGKKAETLQTVYVTAFAEKIASENNFLQTEKAGRELKSLSLTPVVEERVMNDLSLNSTTSWTYQQQQQMRSTTDGLTAQNPDRIYVEQRMKAMQSYEKKLENQIRSSAKQIIYGKRDYELKKELIEVRNKTEKARKIEEELLKQLQSSKEEAVRISLGIRIGESLTARLKHNRDLLDRIDTRVHELEVEAKAPLRISIESAARRPDKPKGSNTQKLLMAVFAFAFGGIGFVFLAFEFFDNRIRRPEEIRSALGYPPLEPVLAAPPEIPFHQVLHLAPQSPSSKSINSLAVKLGLEKKKNDARVILFTGVDRENGTTMVAFNCAGALSGIAPKVLFIEANLVTPSMGMLQGEHAGRSGLGECLEGTGAFADYVVHSPEFGFDLIAAGQKTDGQVSKLRIPDLIAWARNGYDFVCIDTFPLLESDLTEFFSLSADIAVLLCQEESTMYKDLRRAAERLVRLEVPAIAPLLNKGGVKRILSIDRFLANQPGFLGKINTKNLEEFIRDLPPAAEVLQKVQKIITGFGERVNKRAESVREKRRKKTSKTKGK
ncbi:MAG: hypothetical protein HGA62_03880 [Chlorobiaceae bacterium]|nr:hypothetical protein [Chlorobiaceae bacterium]NTV60843.1 hypothetical protein [Chlorobiaceae bacterium]